MRGLLGSNNAHCLQQEKLMNTDKNSLLTEYPRVPLAAGILPQPKARLETLVAVALTVLGVATILSLLVIAY